MSTYLHEKIRSVNELYLVRTNTKIEDRVPVLLFYYMSVLITVFSIRWCGLSALRNDKSDITSKARGDCYEPGYTGQTQLHDH